MKILITHNDYGRHSGEETAVDNMGEMMQAHGHQVCFYRPGTTAHQKGLISKIRVFLAGLYSLRGIRAIKKTLHTEHPDMINVHNLYPFISPAALFACRSADVPIVMTVHNYRLMCPTGLFLRNGRPCEHCLHKGNEWGCVRFNCEKNFFKSLAYALRGFIARKTGAYKKNVDRYVCLTSFQKKKLIEAGFAEEKIKVIPNSIPVTSSWSDTPGKYIAYVGRLSEEKGWDMLMEIAERSPDLPIEAAGFNGTSITDLRSASVTHLPDAPVPDLPPNIRLRGHLTGEQLTDFYRHARFLVIPSRCYEGFPLVALEAMAMGKTVVAPDHGGFTDIIGKGPEAIGRLFQANNSIDLEAVIRQLWRNETLSQHLGKKCLEKIKTSYTSEIVYGQWQQLFGELSKIPKNAQKN